MTSESSMSSKEQRVALALTSGEAKLIALVIKREVALTAGEDGLNLPAGNYALIVLPDTAAPEGVYAIRAEPAQA